MINEEDFQKVFTKQKAADHYQGELKKLKWQQFGLLIEQWNRGRAVIPEYTLKSAVERVERDNDMNIMPAVMRDIKDFIELTLAKGE